MNILNKNRISRRHFTKEILYKGGLLAVSGFGSCFFFKNATAADTLQKKLSQAIDGRVITSTILLKEYSYDFGHMIRKEPRIVVVPKSREDILKVFEIADSFGVPISIRGCGHSCIGQSLSDGGIILHNYKTTAGYSKNKDMLTVSSNTEISLLEKSLNTHGLTNPVLPYFLDLTLGGVLSAGGVGPLSIKRGILAENINKLTLITPQGESVTCSAEKNSDIFRYALCGQGQLGIIIEAEYKCAEYKKFACVVAFRPSTTDEMLSLVKRACRLEREGVIDFFGFQSQNLNTECHMGKLFPEKKEAEAYTLDRMIGESNIENNSVVIEDSHFLYFSYRKTSVIQQGVAYHLWLDMFFGDTGYEEFLKFVKERIQKEAIEDVVFVIIPVKNQRRISIPFSPVNEAGDDYNIGITVWFDVEYGDIKQRNRCQNLLKRFLEKGLSLKGRPYLSGLVNLNTEQKKALYGTHYDALKRLKQKVDPSGILNPGMLSIPNG